MLDLKPEDETSSKGGKRRRKGGGKSPKNGGDDVAAAPATRRQFATRLELGQHLKLLRSEMMAAAKNLDFELAAQIRDEVFRLEKLEMELL